jgi:hypothetical protein
MAAGRQTYFHAADLLQAEFARDAFRRIADAEGRFAPDDVPPVPQELPDATLNARMLRRLRERHGAIDPDIAAFIMAKPQYVEVAVMPTNAERVGVFCAIAMAVFCAPFAIALAAWSLGQTGLAMVTGSAGGGWQDIALATAAEAAGYLAAASMLLSFLMSSRLLLRLFALAGNIFFISYGIGSELVPVVLLHGVLLPVNFGHLLRAVRSWNARPYGGSDRVHSVVRAA